VLVFAALLLSLMLVRALDAAKLAEAKTMGPTR